MFGVSVISVGVMFIDHGNFGEDMDPAHSICSLPEEFTRLPPQAIPCALHQVS